MHGKIKHNRYPLKFLASSTLENRHSVQIDVLEREVLQGDAGKC